MNISIWNYKDYKEFLKMLSRSADRPRGFITRLAEAGGCQPSYLSQVLNSKVQLTPDQACGMAEYLNLSEIETEYFMMTVDCLRAGSPKLKKLLNHKLENLRARSEIIGDRLKRPSWSANEFQSSYYSSWLWGAIHILVSIPEFQTTEAIAKRLNLGVEVVSEKLKKLEDAGLIKRKSGFWHHSGAEIHLEKNSPFISHHHNNWRSLAVLNSQSLDKSKQSIHFSGVYAVSKSDIEVLRKLVLKMIENANRVAGDSASEDLVCLTCDLFEV